MFWQKMLALLLSVSLCIASENTEKKVPLTKEELKEIIEQIDSDPNLWPELLTIECSDEPLSLTIKYFNKTYYKIYESIWTDEILPSEIYAQEEFYNNILDCINNNDPDCIKLVLVHQNNWENQKSAPFWESYEKDTPSLLIKQIQGQNGHAKWLKAQKETVKKNQLNELKLLVKKLLAYIQVKHLEK